MQTLKENFRSVVELISSQAKNNPHSIALSCGDQRVSFEELDHRAKQFAGHLAELGVASGASVAICMERSVEWIVGALGTMRAGAAYIPLDSTWPDSRLRFAVEESGASCLVARAALQDRLRVKARGVDPFRDAQAIEAAAGVAHRSVEPESLAYVIYTSGSTGVPKGVEITHANLCHLVRWHVEAFAVTPQDRASHVAGLGFDAAVWEIWPNLCAGATLCLPDDEVRSAPQLLQEWMIRERVTIGFVPTVHTASMMAMKWPACTELRLLLTGGDKLHQGPTVELPFDVVNNYGPTECTVVATSAVLPRSIETPPIGLPITGATVYLLNEHGQQVPSGCAGEIYIGGSGVGRGYRNLPELTEKYFLPDPFIGVPGARMYRTGDRGIQRPDGQIEFCGRLDRQTKIRGQRIELDEIGSVLSRHPSIDFAVAIAVPSKAGVNQLVAYVLPKENSKVPTSQELQSYLLSRLPDYMVPVVFLRLHALPISPNGKVDLGLLPPPLSATSLEGEVSITAPASPVEEKLLAIAQQILENDAVSAKDSFFLAGGHSLLALQLLMRVREAFDVDLTLRQLFEAPTVERLATLVESILKKTNHPAFQQAEPDQVCGSETLDLPPGVFAIRRNGNRKGIFWIHYQGVELAREFGDDQPFFSVMLAAEDFDSVGENPTMQKIAACLVRKILATQANGPYVLGGYCLGGIVAYEIACQMRAARKEVSLLALLDPPSPSCASPCNSLSLKLSYVKYLLKRGTRLGARTSLVYLSERVAKWFADFAGAAPPRTEMRIAQEMCEAAMSKYQPKRYGGEVLLQLAGERPPHMNFLPGWQAVITNKLHVQYLDAHKRDLTRTENMRTVAGAITSHIPVEREQEIPLSGPVRDSGPILMPALRPDALQMERKII